MTAVGEFLSGVPWWAVITLGVITIVYEYLTWHFGYWEKEGVKGDKPRPFTGTFDVFPEQKPLEIQDQNAYKKHGRVCGIYEGRKPALIVGDPELLRTIMVKEFHTFTNRRNFHEQDQILSKGLFQMKGEEWNVLRKVMVPTFSTGKMKQMVTLMEECAEQLVNHLEKLAETGESFETKDLMTSYALDVIATCAFGIKVDSVRDRNSKFVQYAMQAFGVLPKWFFLFFLIPEWLKKYLPSFMKKESVTYLAQFVQNVISDRNREAKPRRDLLQLLLEAKAEAEKEHDKDETEEQKNITAIQRKVLGADYISAQSVLALTAGFETASITLRWAMYYLSIDEKVQKKMHKEIDEILVKKHKNTFNYDMMSEMHYLDMVVNEILRIAPPVGRLERVCEEDGYVLNGISLKKDMVIAIPVYAMHHDPEFYPNPKIFDPERFSPKIQNDRDPLTYLPFGYGPRNCIGSRFAFLELKIGLIYMFRAYRAYICPETQIPFTRKPNAMFFEPNSVIIRLEKRKV